MEEDIYKKVVLPHKSNEGTWTFGITTPQDGNNFVSTMMDLKDEDGKYTFTTLCIGKACKICRLKGEADKCKHIRIAPWKSVRGIKQIKTVLENDKATFDREMRGKVAGNDVRIYRPFIKKFTQLQNYIFQYPPRVMFSTIDNSGGGAGSDFAIITKAVENGLHVIIGAEWSDSKDPEVIDRLVVNHYLGLRRIQKYRTGLLCVAIESNYGGWQNAARIADVIQPHPAHVLAQSKHRALVNGVDLGPRYLLCRDPQHGSDRGVWTGPEQKEGGAELLRQVLLNNSLAISADFFTQNAAGIEGFKRTFVDQLSNFRDIPRPLKDPVFQDPKHKLTGKIGGKKDDLCVACQLNLYWRIITLGNVRFQQMCAGMGIEI